MEITFSLCLTVAVAYGPDIQHNPETIQGFELLSKTCGFPTQIVACYSPGPKKVWEMHPPRV